MVQHHDQLHASRSGRRLCLRFYYRHRRQTAHTSSWLHSHRGSHLSSRRHRRRSPHKHPRPPLIPERNRRIQPLGHCLRSHLSSRRRERHITLHTAHNIYHNRRVLWPCNRLSRLATRLHYSGRPPIQVHHGFYHRSTYARCHTILLLSIKMLRMTSTYHLFSAPAQPQEIRSTSNDSGQLALRSFDYDCMGNGDTKIGKKFGPADEGRKRS